MYRYILCVCIFLSLQKISLQKSSKSSVNYIGGVVQYYPQVIIGNDYEDARIVQENIKNYVNIIEYASKQDVDILVFPEYGLTGIPEFERKKSHVYTGSEQTVFDLKMLSQDKCKNVSETKYHKTTNIALKYRKAFAFSAVPISNGATPCVSTTFKQKYMINLSCAARKYKIYLVINHLEKEKCLGYRHCPEDGFFLWNTNTVFDRSGTIVSHYRKYNTYYEPWLESEAEVEISVFTSDFGVTFGHFIGFDFMISNLPNALKIYNVTDVLLSTSLQNDVLFLNTVQDYSFWSFEHKLNLLVAGFSRDGSSEIYYGHKVRNIENEYDYYKDINALHIGEIIKYNSIDNYKTKLLNYTKVPLTDNKNVMRKKNYNFYQSSNEFYEILKTGEYYSQLLNIENKWKNEKIRLCTWSYCCNFEIATVREGLSPKDYNFYSYRAIAFRGVYKLRNDSLVSTEICAVVACTSDDIKDCGKTYPSNDDVATITFHSIMINRDIRFRRLSHRYTPVTLINSENGMIPGDDYEFEEIQHDINRDGDCILNTRKTHKNILLFGINTRVFDDDGWYVKIGAVNKKFRWTMAFYGSISVIFIVIGVIYIFDKWERSTVSKKANIYVIEEEALSPLPGFADLSDFEKRCLVHSDIEDDRY